MHTGWDDEQQRKIDEADTLRRQRDEALRALRELVADMDRDLYPDEAVDTYQVKHKEKLKAILAQYTEDAE